MAKTLEFPYEIKSFPVDLLKVYGSSMAGNTGGSIDALLASSEINLLFGDVTRDQAVSGVTQYRKLFIKNESGMTGNTITFKLVPRVNISIGFGSDVGTSGTLGTVVQPTAAGVISVSSSDNSDSMDLEVVGEYGIGTLAAETISLTGTTPAAGSQTFARVINLQLTSGPTGSVTVTRSNNLATLQPGEILRFAYFTTETISWGNLASGSAIPVWLERVITAGAAPLDTKEFVVINGS